MKDSLSCFFNCSFVYDKLLHNLQQHYSNRKVILLGSTLVPTTVLVMESAHLVTQLPVGCTANVTNIGRGRLATSRTVGTTVEAPTTATATSQGRSCASATTVGKVSGSSVLTNNDGKGPDVSIDVNHLRSAHLPETIRNGSLLANSTHFHRATNPVIMPIMLEDVNSDNCVYRCVVLISNVKYCVCLPERKLMIS